MKDQELKSPAELKQIIQSAEGLVKIGSNYKHYKYPDRIYIVVDIVIIEETKEAGVLYKEQTGELESVIFIRPLSNFLEKIDDSIYRFSHI